jgi:hypothetical protein
MGAFLPGFLSATLLNLPAKSGIPDLSCRNRFAFYGFTSSIFSMQLVSQHFTLLIGIDVHFTTLPPFNPVQPFIGLLIDPMDYVPFVGGRSFSMAATGG